VIVAILKKDLRSGWYWVVGMTILMTGYIILNLASWPAEFTLGRVIRPFAMLGVIDVDTRFPLVRLTEGVVFGVFYGIGFGMWNALPEVGGASGFFFMRPCSRTRLATGKLIAGTVMYWVPGLVSTAVGVAWCRMAALSAPLEPWMAAAPLLLWLIGYMFYLAAVAAAWRPARWYGGRLLPLLLPVPLGFVMLEVVSEMETAWEIGAVFVVVLWVVDLYLLRRWEG
jgi:hypothetical protein